jgi:5'-methylthioadenosine phosphorylase
MANTPFGEVHGAVTPEGYTALVRGTDARATIYAAKEMGARRVLAGEAVQAVSPLLEPGDVVIPADVIDQTRLRPFTFFVGKGYGFIKLNPPFCPNLMATALAVARERNARSFKGGVYVCTEGPRSASPAELRMFRQWGADLVGSALLPETYLARELELHYAAVAVVGDGSGLGGLLAAVAGAAERGDVACTCGDTMKFAKAQGAVGEDWKRWISRCVKL